MITDLSPAVASAASTSLAAGGSSSILLIVIGVAVVALLLGAFWLGSRRASQRKDPAPRPAPSDQTGPAAARQDSWRTPDADDRP
ncbi:DUF6479 family protein [Streptomyces genisteinicus]|uniref:Uncharacterized protein n=1 Tax=Streptomyces genisteinicus TaxID=2768068 RepID=A0A7H0I241_9ACTN|nr:DUF6479 family protein [Streptomyces genisteinicus]QNP66857.1 hypothetical protein IAG43_30675 [Streptomyces genisteinicus]